MSSATPPGGGSRPQASIDMDLGAEMASQPTGPIQAVPATATQIAAELCTFREDVHGLRRDQRGMTDKLIEGQERISNGQDSVVSRLDSLIDGNGRIEVLLERIALATELASVEMDKLEDISRKRFDQEKERAEAEDGETRRGR